MVPGVNGEEPQDLRRRELAEIRMREADRTGRLRLDQANLHPVGADVSVRRIDRLEVDLQHLDARLDCALLKLRVGLEVRIVDNKEVWLLRDRVGYRARAGVPDRLRSRPDR